MFPLFSGIDDPGEERILTVKSLNGSFEAVDPALFRYLEARPRNLKKSSSTSTQLAKGA